MDDKIQAVLTLYHERMQQERSQPRVEAPGGRDGEIGRAHV